MADPIPYASDDRTRREARPTRSVGTWIKLLIVWTVGLIVWTFYVVAILYGFFRVMM